MAIGTLGPGLCTAEFPLTACDTSVAIAVQDGVVTRVTADRDAVDEAMTTGHCRHCRNGLVKRAENKGSTLFVKNRLNYALTISAKVPKGLAMGIDTPTGDTRKLEELDRLIEGRWALINRLFEDVEELVEERDRLAGRHTGFLDRLFGRRQQAPAPVGNTMVRRPEVRRPSSSKSADRLRRGDEIRVVS